MTERQPDLRRIEPDRNPSERAEKDAWNAHRWGHATNPAVRRRARGALSRGTGHREPRGSCEATRLEVRSGAGRTYSPPWLWRGRLHERTERLRHGTRESEGRGPDGRHLRSRDDGPRAQPHDPLHHGTGTPSAPGPRGRRDRSPDLRA